MAASGVNVSDLLASAFSAQLDSNVVTFEKYQQDKDAATEESQYVYYQPLDVDQLFNITHLYGKFGEKATVFSGDTPPFDIYVTTLTGNILTIRGVVENETIGDIKERIFDLESIPPEQQRLIFNCRQLLDRETLKDCNFKAEDTLHLVMRMTGGGGGPPTFFVDDSLMDPKFDYDFSNKVSDGKKYYRGGFEYHRPYGWKRFAIKVLGRFKDDDWLGEAGQRCRSSRGEWPVSYHGTGKSESGSIAQDGFRLSKGQRFKYGKGIYSTPSIEVAARYAKEFVHHGKTYKIVFQNRVSPAGLKVINLQITGVGEYWVQPREELIRPYGICIQLQK